MLSRVPTPADHDISLRTTFGVLAGVWVVFMGLNVGGFELAAEVVRVGGIVVAVGLVVWHVGRYRYERRSPHHPL